MSDIKVGDYVKAEFTDSPEAGTYTIEGKVHTYVNTEALWLGPRCFQIAGDRIPGFTILEHKPKRMDEPDEFGAMVEAGTHVEGDSPRERRPLVRHQTSGTLQWSDEHGRTYAWSELVDPQPVSPI